MWIESESGAIINSYNILKIFISDNILSPDHKALCYTSAKEQETKVLYENLTEKDAKIIYENLKVLLRLNMNFLSKEQLLEGTNIFIY